MQYCLFLYAILVIGLEITVWEVPSSVLDKKCGCGIKLFFHMVQHGD